MKVDSQFIRQVENAHYNLVKVWVSRIQPIDGATLVFNDKAKDYYWNLAGQIDTTSERAEELIETVSKILRENNRQPVFYVTPATFPKNFPEILKKHGFEQEDVESWMFRETKDPIEIKIKPPADFTIKEIGPDEREIFVKTFDEAYSGPPGEGYTGLDPAYPQILCESFDRPEVLAITKNFLGFLDKKPAGVASVVWGKELAEIINVGTVSWARKKGVGSTLSARAFEEAVKQGVKTVFLITEKGSIAEKMYQEIGFKTLFNGSFWVLPEKK